MPKADPGPWRSPYSSERPSGAALVFMIHKLFVTLK